MLLQALLLPALLLQALLLPSWTNSQYCLMVKCHVFILMRSSKVNSKISLPSVHTLVNMGFPRWVTIARWPQATVMDELW